VTRTTEQAHQSKAFYKSIIEKIDCILLYHKNKVVDVSNVDLVFFNNANFVCRYLFALAKVYPDEVCVAISACEHFKYLQIEIISS
jgi:hypothetical protein